MKLQISKNLNGKFTFAFGKIYGYFNREDGNWYAYDIDKNLPLNNKGLAVKFTDEKNLICQIIQILMVWKRIYRQRFSVIIKDEYDFWEFFLERKNSSKKHHQQFRKEK